MNSIEKTRCKVGFLRGAQAGLPIALGYLSVSFSFGMVAVSGGMPAWAAILISMTNLTSAGQFAGTNLMIAGAAYTEIAITTVVINLRYLLMSLSLSQKLEKMPLLHRMLLAFGITDEIFAVASTAPGKVSAPFLAGLITTPYIGWGAGTALGAVLNNLLPERIVSAMGIMLYAMFIAILIPAARKEKPVLFVLILAVFFSCLLYYIPQVTLSMGWAMILAAIAAAGIGAFFFPRKEELQ